MHLVIAESITVSSIVRIFITNALGPSEDSQSYFTNDRKDDRDLFCLKSCVEFHIVFFRFHL